MSTVSPLIDPSVLTTFQSKKKVRYISVSIVTAPIGQILLYLFFVTLSLNALASNVLAVAIATIPNYLLNRFWVWNKNQPHSFRQEIVPYWSMAFVGLALSTCFVLFASSMWNSWVAINSANASGYALLWGVKYFILDRYVFSNTESTGT